MRLEKLTGESLADAIEEVAHLRIAIFRDWPYLYDGDLNYERAYLQHYQNSPEALIVGAFVGDWLVGASTAAPLKEHEADFADAFHGSSVNIDRTFYCGESILLPRYRGQGVGHQFFEIREDHARQLGYSNMCFCSVMRPEDHPMRPQKARAMDAFWEGRGYASIPGVTARFSWKDVDQLSESQKKLQFWMRKL